MKRKYKQGFYKPLNEEKYRQPQDRTMNSQIYPEYRSSWELAFMRYLDSSENIEFWGTESFAIWYISPKDNKKHRYYIDFMFKTKDGIKYLVEIKPSKQKNNPINIAKWGQAERYAKQIQAIFTVVTEIELKKWGLL
jgi:hypothetical protein